MERNSFWNDAARCGAVIGGLLGVSYLLETAIQLSGNMMLYVLLVLEFFGVVALHYYLLHRYTRCRSMLYSADEGFTFGQGYGFLLTISGFAGIILGCVQAVYLHLIVGYSAFVERTLAALSEILSRNGGMNASVEPFFSQLVAELQSAAAPSVVQTVLGGIWSSLFFGLVFGLIIAGVLSRQPKPFDTPNGQ